MGVRALSPETAYPFAMGGASLLGSLAGWVAQANGFREQGKNPFRQGLLVFPLRLGHAHQAGIGVVNCLVTIPLSRFAAKLCFIFSNDFGLKSLKLLFVCHLIFSFQFRKRAVNIKYQQIQLFSFCTQKFEMDEQGMTSWADYRLSGDRLYIDHVESPPALRGTGAAGRLMEALAADAQARGLRITPICGYAATWLRRHKEYAALVG